MALREAGTLRLDDPVGQHVTGLHRSVATVTLGQLLSHSAGIIRDGTDSGQWQDRRPFLNSCELKQSVIAQAV
jgi:D-alanyl-D-alanine carboxypeptidase